MLARWLTIQQSANSPGEFLVWKGSEQSLTEAELSNLASPFVRDHLVSRDLIAKAAELLPESQLRSFLRARMPNKAILRRGMLGEIVAVQLLEEVHGHNVPVRKLHYRTAPHDSPKATDVLALRIEGGKIIEVAYVEAKYRSTRNDMAGLVVNAHSQLKNDCTEVIPAIIGFAAEVLLQKDDPLLAPLLNYLASRSVESIDSHHIVLMTEGKHWKDSDLDLLGEQDELLDPLAVHIIEVTDLVNKTDLIYAAIDCIAIQDDE